MEVDVHTFLGHCSTDRGNVYFGWAPISRAAYQVSSIQRMAYLFNMVDRG